MKHTHTGTNGTFANACNAEGNLIAYACATESPCTPAPYSMCTTLNTGPVIATPTVIDCSGGCSDARCDGLCPRQGDRVSLVDVKPDGTTILHNDTDGRTYQCMRDPNGVPRKPLDTPADYYDCAGLHAGQGGTVAGSGVDDTCTGANFGGLSILPDGPTPPHGEVCGYSSCGIVRESSNAQ